MNPKLRFIISVTVASALAGCAMPYRARVTHISPAGPRAPEYDRALASLYLLVVRPPRPGENTAERILDGVLRRNRPDVNAPGFASAAARGLSGPGSVVCAYRVVPDEEKPDPYLELFAPAGVMILRLESPLIEAKPENREIIVRGKKGKSEKRTVTVWKYAARLPFRARLTERPGGGLLDEYSDAVACSGEGGAGEEDALNWYYGVEKDLISDLRGKLTLRFLGNAVQRWRPVLKEGKQPDSVQAYDAARRGDWTQAARIWEDRLRSGAGDWRDRFNLALAAERRLDFETALALYEKARQEGASAGKAKKIPWDDVLKDLSSAASKPRAVSKGADEWFGRRIAVLPFSDETTSVDAPELVRNAVFTTLMSEGHAVLAMEEVDAVLREHGFTQGGQLNAAAPSDIARWLDADRLFFGHVSEFKEIMLGVYHKRAVAGSLTIWDKTSGGESWEAEEQVVRDRSDTRLEFIGQLAHGLWERIKKSPLGYETGLFVRRCLEPLPMRPASGE